MKNTLQSSSKNYLQVSTLIKTGENNTRPNIYEKGWSDQFRKTGVYTKSGCISFSIGSYPVTIKYFFNIWGYQKQLTNVYMVVQWTRPGFGIYDILSSCILFWKRVNGIRHAIFKGFRFLVLVDVNYCRLNSYTQRCHGKTVACALTARSNRLWFLNTRDKMICIGNATEKQNRKK